MFLDGPCLFNDYNTTLVVEKDWKIKKNINKMYELQKRKIKVLNWQVANLFLTYILMIIMNLTCYKRL